MSDPVQTPPPAAPAAPAPGTPAYDAAMIAKADAAAGVTTPAAPASRPEYVPEKFWNAEKGEVNVEAMAKSYGELERTRGTPPVTPPVAPKAPTPGSGVTLPTDAQATAAVQNAGLDMVALQAEFVENNGDLTPETYTKLEQSGIPKPMVDAYIAGQKALAADYDNSIRQAAGGADEYGKLTEWAKAGLTLDEKVAFNKAVSSGDKAQAQLAVAGLKARMGTTLGNPPSNPLGGGNAPAGEVYESYAQVTTDMKKPEYSKDPAFRAKVMAKLDRSNFGAIRTAGMA